MGMAVGKRSNSVMCEMNTTPMIDLLIVLIVIFMLQPMTGVASYDLQLPIEGLDSVQQFNPIVLEIHADGTADLNTKRLEQTTIKQFLHEIYDRRPDKIISLKASPLVEYGKVIEYIDVARSAGVKVIGVLLPGSAPVWGPPAIGCSFPA